MDNRNEKLANNLINNSIFLDKNDALVVEVIREKRDKHQLCRGLS